MIRKNNGMRSIFLTLFIGALVSYFAIYPLGSVLISSFWRQGAESASFFTFQSYLDVFNDPIMYQAVRNSLLIAVGTTAFSGLLGILLAWVNTRTNMPGRSALSALNLLPFFLSPLVLALSWRILAAPNNGMINHFFSMIFGKGVVVINIYSVWGIIWVLTTFFTPYVYLFALGSMQRMDARLEEAARVSGASLMQTAFRVTIPLSAPAILSGLLLVFVTSAGIIDVPLLLGDPHQIFTLPTMIYQAVNIYPARYDIASVISTGLIVLTLLIIIAQQGYLSRRSFVVQTSKSDTNPLVFGYGKYVLLAINIIYLLITIVLPVGALAIASFSSFWSGVIDFSSMTLRHYTYVLFDYSLTWRAIGNTSILATSAATIAVIVGTIFVYSFDRLKIPFNKTLAALATLPVTIPGVVVGMGFLVIWVGTPLYATLWILLFSFVVNFLGIALRIQSAAMASVGLDMEEAARVSGASWFTSIRLILLPLLKTGTVTVWLFLFIIFVRELSTSVLLWSPGNEVLSVAVLIASTQKALPVVAAFSMLQLVILLLSAFVFLRWFGTERIRG